VAIPAPVPLPCIVDASLDCVASSSSDQPIIINVDACATPTTPQAPNPSINPHHSTLLAELRNASSSLPCSVPEGTETDIIAGFSGDPVAEFGDYEDPWGRLALPTAAIINPTMPAGTRRQRPSSSLANPPALCSRSSYTRLMNHDLHPFSSIHIRTSSGRVVTSPCMSVGPSSGGLAREIRHDQGVMPASTPPTVLPSARSGRGRTLRSCIMVCLPFRPRHSTRCSL
jgi:hypothetical protein